MIRGHHGRRSLAGGAVTPADLASAVFWHSFGDQTQSYTDAGVTLVTADGDLIQQCNDRTTNNLNLIQPVIASRGTNEQNEINGQAVLQCAGDHMYVPLPVGGLEQYYAGANNSFAVILSASGYGTDTTFCGAYSAAENRRRWLMRTRAGGRVEFFVDFDSVTSGNYRSFLTTDAFAADSVFCFGYDGSIDTNDGLDRFDVRVNDVPVAGALGLVNGPLGDIPLGFDVPIGLNGTVKLDGTISLAATAARYGNIIFLHNPSDADKSLACHYAMDQWALE